MKSLQEVYIFFRISNSLHYVKGLNLWVHFKSSLILIVRVNVVLNRTVVVDSNWRFDNLCGSHLQSQSELYHVSWWYYTLVIDLIGQLRRNVILWSVTIAPPPPTILPTLLLLSLFPIELVAKSVFLGDPFQAVYTRNSAVSFTSLFLSSLDRADSVQFEELEKYPTKLVEFTN